MTPRKPKPKGKEEAGPATPRPKQPVPQSTGREATPPSRPRRAPSKVDKRPPEERVPGKPLDGSKNPGGRPTEWTKARIDQAAADLLVWFDDEENLFFEKFAHEMDMPWSYLLEIGKGNTKFSEAYARVKEIQKLRLAEGGLKGKFNPQMTYNTMKNVCGWRDKTEVEHSGKVNQIVRYHKPERKKLE